MAEILRGFVSHSSSPFDPDRNHTALLDSRASGFNFSSAFIGKFLIGNKPVGYVSSTAIDCAHGDKVVAAAQKDFFREQYTVIAIANLTQGTIDENEALDIGLRHMRRFMVTALIIALLTFWLVVPLLLLIPLFPVVIMINFQISSRKRARNLLKGAIEA